MRCLNYLLSLPKSLYYNLKVFPLKQAVKMPIFLSWNTKVVGLKRNAIQIEGELKPFLFRLGLGGSLGVPANSHSALIIDSNSKIVLKGKVNFGEGSVIRVDDGAVLNFGKNVRGTKNVEIYCSDSIEIGDDVLIGWNVAIRDVDGHSIIDKRTGIQLPSKKPVTIGNHVWIASHVDILKGAEIPNGCVVAYRSCVLNQFEDQNSIIAGYPAKVTRTEIEWNAKKAP